MAWLDQYVTVDTNKSTWKVSRFVENAADMYAQRYPNRNIQLSIFCLSRIVLGKEIERRNRD